MAELFRQAVATQTGQEPDDLTVWADPTEPGTWGARVRTDVTVAYFLHKAENGPVPTAETLQEVDFADWPPWHGSRGRSWYHRRPRRGRPPVSY